jgi:hypothetical protein
MPRHRVVSLRWRAAQKYQSHDPGGAGTLFNVWAFLEAVTHGEVEIDPPVGAPKVYRVVCEDGTRLHLSMGRPAPGG